MTHESLQEWPITVVKGLHDNYMVSETEEWLKESSDLPLWWIEEYAGNVNNSCYEVLVDIECHKDGTCILKGIS